MLSRDASSTLWEEGPMVGSGAAGLGGPHRVLLILVLLSVLHANGHVSHLSTLLMSAETEDGRSL